MTREKHTSGEKRKIATDLILMLIIPAAVILLWQELSTAGILNRSILPPPSAVVDCFVRLYQKGTLWEHIGSSCLRVGKGFLVASVLGVVLGILIALSKTLDKMLTVLIGVLRPIPAIAMIPFLILCFGIGEFSKIAVIFIGAFWPVLLNTMQGIRGTDKKLLEVGQVFGKSRLSIILEIILPSAIPAIFTGLRLGISSAWICVVAAEMIAASSGLGYLVSYGRQMSQPDILLVGIVSIGVIGLLIEIVFLKLQDVVVYWNKEEKG